MPRAASRGSEDSDDENALEAELEKLQRKYKVSEQERLQYNIETQKKIRLQTQLIKNLEEEKEELIKNLNLAESKTNLLRDEVRTEQLVDLLNEKDNRKKEIQDEKDRIRSIEEKILEWEKKLRHKRQEIGGTHAAAEFNAHSKKRQKVLENRLEHALKNFNTILTENANLRDEIDHLRVERESFEQLHSKLERELLALRNEINEIIENSTQAYDQREEAQTKMIMIRDKEEKDKQQHYTELKEVIRVINHDKKLKEFMKIKTQERPEDEELIAWRKRKDMENAEKRRKEKEEHSIEAYESKLREIQNITGENDLDKLVEKFIVVRSRNYALFNFVNELNNNVETLEEEISQINRDIQSFEEQGIKMEEIRISILKDLEQKHRNATRIYEEYEEKIKTNRKILDQCRIGVETLFKKLNCDSTEIDMRLLSKEGVTENNISQYLGIIDNRTDELMRWQSILQAKKENLSFKDKAPNYIGEGALPKITKQQIQLPSTGDGYEVASDSDFDDVIKPLSRAELQSRLLEGVRKRELTFNKDGLEGELDKSKDKTQHSQKQKTKK